MARVPSELILNNVELIRLIGEINLLWDEIEMYLWYIFDDLLGRTDWRYSYVIFFSHQGHRVRRDMLQALASVALESDVYAFAEPRWSRSMAKREKLKAKREARK